MITKRRLGNCRWKAALVAGGGLLIAQATPVNASSSIIEQIVRQTSRQVSGSVGRGIQAEEFDKLTGAGGGSGDTRSLGPLGSGFNTWATPSFTGIEIESGGAEDIADDLAVAGGMDIDLYQMVVGGDTRKGDFVFGFSGSYTRADVNSAGGEVDIGANMYTVTPYASYIVTKNFFITAMAGYNRLQVEDSQVDGNGLFTDISANYMLPIDSYVLTGKVGHRFGYFASEDSTSGVPTPGRDDDSWDNTYYISGDISYKWGDFTPYLTGTWEHFDPEDDPEDFDSAFLRLGFHYDVRDEVTVGLSYTTELTGRAEDSEEYYNQAAMDIKVRF